MVREAAVRRTASGVVATSFVPAMRSRGAMATLAVHGSMLDCVLV
jgi:hypothetical protein